MSDKHLALLVVVIIIIAFVVKDVAKAMLAIGGAIVAWHLLTREGAGNERDKRGQPDEHDTAREQYWPAPGAPPPAPQTVPSVQETSNYGKSGYYTQFGTGSGYPGAIDAQSGETVHDTYPEFGWADRTVLETDYAPSGNPYDTNRLSAPYAAGPCIDDEAYGGALDADESNALQVRSRNDQERVVAGTIRRKAFLDPYLREELEEEEDSRWWGRHEW